MGVLQVPIAVSVGNRDQAISVVLTSLSHPHMVRKGGEGIGQDCHVKGSHCALLHSVGTSPPCQWLWGLGPFCDRSTYCY